MRNAVSRRMNLKYGANNRNRDRFFLQMESGQQFDQCTVSIQVGEKQLRDHVYSPRPLHIQCYPLKQPDYRVMAYSYES